MQIRIRNGKSMYWIYFSEYFVYTQMSAGIFCVIFQKNMIKYWYIHNL